MKTNARGFTLIELMIAVAILGIIAAIAYPSYLNQVRASKRSDARSALLQAANRQERFYTTEYTYSNTLGAGGLGMPDETENEVYTLAINNADGDGFSISANAQGDQLNDDCTTLSINEIGEKTANGAGPNDPISQQCW